MEKATTILPPIKINILILKKKKQDQTSYNVISMFKKIVKKHRIRNDNIT